MIKCGLKYHAAQHAIKNIATLFLGSEDAKKSPRTFVPIDEIKIIWQSCAEDSYKRHIARTDKIIAQFAAYVLSNN